MFWMKKKNVSYYLLLILLLLWIGISLVRTFYNLSKLGIEERKWYFLTDEEKREMQFGDRHRFFRFVQVYTKKGSNILFYTHDGMAYYWGRYYLYPTTVIWGENQYVHWGDDINRNYEYVMIYPLNRGKQLKDVFFFENVAYKKLVEYKIGNSVKGVIYKK